MNYLIFQVPLDEPAANLVPKGKQPSVYTPWISRDHHSSRAWFK